MTKQELLDRLKEIDICASALKWAKEQPDIETILEKCPHDWRIWALCNRLLDFAKHCDWNKLDGWYWSLLLRNQPQFAEHCDWDKLDGHDWLWLLSKQPQFAKHRDWNKLDSYNWSNLLCKHPQLAEYCDWNKLSDNDWSHLLSFQPQLAKYKVARTKVKYD